MTSSAAAKGKWAAHKGFAKRATRGSHMPAETQRHTTPNHHLLPHASYEAFWSIFCYCSPTAQLLQSSSSVTDETNPSVAGRSPKFCASL